MFWFMSRQLCRMEAEADLRALRLGLNIQAASVPSNESHITSFEQSLLLELGDVFKLDGADLTPSPADLEPEFDRAGFESLRMML